MKGLSGITLLVFTILLLNSISFAEDYSTRIKKVADLYDNMEYEKCLKEIAQLEQYKFNLRKEELLELYKYKAFIYILSDRNALAENVIKEIYEIDPDYMLPPSVSPKLREPFARIKKTIRKEEPPKTKVIEAKPVKPDIDERVTIISGPEKPVRKENFFEKNLIPLSIVAGGIALFVPGLIVRLNAASDAENYRNKLVNAPKDELGNIIGITKAEAQQKQDDIDTNVMIGNTLITVGSLAVVGGIATYFVLDKVKKDSKKEKVSLTINENGFVVVGSYGF
ncbi:MAG: hypothetical protein N2746_06595 [Deltaproteobacteria bacterium]|nr:hypothetical protein [Deltaproteobacteria bacterium]